MPRRTKAEVAATLNHYHDLYNKPDFIPDDPIGLVHAFNDVRDREIVGFWVATLAWGRRATIIDKGAQLIELMGGEPYRFITEHREEDRARFADWKHRTFTYTDTLYFLEFLQQYYREHDSLEEAFARHLRPEDRTIEAALRGFHNDFFSLPEAPARTRKHVATPERKSRCKRLCMYLRWMVRQDERGVDFGDWKQIRPDQLCLPLDVHVERVARQLGLLKRKQCDWKAVVELTDAVRRFDPEDPTKYDFALFGMGVEGVKI
ncbi:TIGR02757 family protein [Neolewinella agarilytica]|uniref:TIGR02757 family protein n=1 Tax=Neolewinella agarilytica TaxID=478744 RepID=A0A1H9G8I9_9BACT|nr:TIGR02757 family protein [Neolewinella agarilytica]SEQ46078.1 TIGR02757 family protein [Neolewinella agarilytica]